MDFKNATPKYIEIKQSLPQGSVLSQTLFNLYMSDLRGK